VRAAEGGGLGKAHVLALAAFACVAVVALSALFGDERAIGTAPSAERTALNVDGNRLVDATGRQVVLRGVNRMGFEYSCVQNKGLFDAPLDPASVDAITSWGANAVRLPLNEHCWLGLNGVPSGDGYRHGVERYVDLLLARDLYVILDLHWSAAGNAPAATQAPMPNTDHSEAFWRSVAEHFKGDDRVLFDLFNEPVPNRNQRDITDDAARRSWMCWRDGADGGTCDAVQLNGMAGSQVVGMQRLVDAVRVTGATNVILLGGIHFANTLWSNPTRNWLTYKPIDPLGKLAASWHAYNGTWCTSVSCYETEVAPIAAEVPVIAGEVGNDECDAEWMTTLLDWLDKKEASYLAWVWNTWLGADCAARRLIIDYTGTPSPYGQIYKARLDAWTQRESPRRH
jgi:endoglucanase